MKNIRLRSRLLIISLALISLGLLPIYTSLAVAQGIPSCVEYSRWIRGDANEDNAVDLTDAIFILRYLVRGGKRPSCLQRADFNGDAKVDLTDPIGILRWRFSSGSGPDEPVSEEQIISTGIPEVNILLEGRPIDSSVTDEAQIPEITIKLPTIFEVISQKGHFRSYEVKAYPMVGDDVDYERPIRIKKYGVESTDGAAWLDPFEFEIGAQAGIEIGSSYLVEVTCIGFNGQEDTDRVIVQISSQVRSDEPYNPFEFGGWYEVPSDSGACTSCKTFDPEKPDCAEASAICCHWPDDLSLPSRCIPVDVNNPLQDAKLKLRCGEGSDNVPNAYCESACMQPMHRCCQNEKGDTICLKRGDGGPADPMQCEDLDGVSGVAGGGSISSSSSGQTSSNPYKKKCEVGSMEILWHHSDWPSVPAQFKIPRIYYWESEIPPINEQMQEQFKGYFPGYDFSKLTLKGVLDSNHYKNELLGPIEGWLYGTDLKVVKIDGRPGPYLRHRNGYEAGLGFLLVATLTEGSDPDLCYEAQFMQVTCNERDGRTEGPSTGKFMYRTDELLKVKGLKQLREEGKIPEKENEISQLRFYDSGQRCLAEGNDWCLDGYLYPLDREVTRPDSSKMLKRHFPGSSGMQTMPAPNSSGLAYYQRLPLIVWWDIPGAIIELRKFLKTEDKKAELLPLSTAVVTLERERFDNFIQIIEEPEPRVIEVVVNPGQTNEQKEKQFEWRRWVCEFKGLHNIYRCDGSKLQNIPENEIKCKCYPQWRKSPTDNWERIPGAGPEGFIETNCN